MATFALFYQREDLTALAAEATNPGLTPSERQYAQRLWNAGLKDWASSPTAPDEYACVLIPFDPTGQPGYAGKTITNMGGGTWRVCDPNILIVVVSGPQVSKQQTVDWCRLIGGKYPGAAYLENLASDIEAQAVEPWPVV